MPTERHSFQILGKSTQQLVEVDIPSTCPHCFVTISPVILFKSLFDESLKKSVCITYRCPNCFEFFVSSHKNFVSKMGGYYSSSVVKYNYRKPIVFDLPVELKDFSNSFYEIYIQALTAESESLNHIAGIGYRKALEFLIKDFLINFEMKPEDTIKPLHLAQAIKLLSSDNIKSLATASTWLGNDETHYVRIHVDKDIEDLKRFIKSLSHYISHEITLKEAQKFISQKNEKVQ